MRRHAARKDQGSPFCFLWVLAPDWAARNPTSRSGTPVATREQAKLAPVGYSLLKPPQMSWDHERVER